jgi:hypothetical protein
MDDNQKSCPYCKETIHKDAIKCKHCNTSLVQPVAAPVVSTAVSQPQAESNTEAILSFVFSFLAILPYCGFIFTIASLILGFIGLNKAKKLNGEGKGFAIAGLVISALVILVYLCLLSVYVIAMIAAVMEQ